MVRVRFTSRATRQILHRARARLHRRGGQAHRAALRNNHAVRARAFRAADDRAKVMRIGHAVKDDEERRFAALFRQSQHVVHRLIRISGDDGDQPLMAGRHRVQMRSVHFLHDDLLFARHRNDFAGRTDELSLCNQQLLHIAARFERFADGVAADEQVARFFLLLCGRRGHRRSP